MSEGDLARILEFAIEQLNKRWESPSAYSYENYVILLDQDKKNPRIWRLHVFEDGIYTHTLDFEPSP